MQNMVIKHAQLSLRMQLRKKCRSSLILKLPWDNSQERTQFYKSDIISVAAIHTLIKSLVIERKIPTYVQKFVTMY